MSSSLSIPTTYAQALATLSAGRHPADGRTVANNTRLEFRADGSAWNDAAQHARVPSDGATAETRPIALKLHGTDVATYRPDGWTVLRMNGWDTLTTRDRINAAIGDVTHAPLGDGSNDADGIRRPIITGGWSVWSRNSEPWVHCGGYAIVPFVEGVAVRADGAVGMSREITERSGSNDYVRATVVDVVLTAEGTAQAIAAGQAEALARQAKRVERLRRQHPFHRGWNAYASDCPLCVEDDARWRAASDTGNGAYDETAGRWSFVRTGRKHAAIVLDSTRPEWSQDVTAVCTQCGTATVRGTDGVTRSADAVRSVWCPLGPGETWSPPALDGSAVANGSNVDGSAESGTVAS